MKLYNLTQTQQKVLLKVAQSDGQRLNITGEQELTALDVLEHYDLVEYDNDDETGSITDFGKDHLKSYGFIDDTGAITDTGTEFLNKKQTFKDFLSQKNQSSGGTPGAEPGMGNDEMPTPDDSGLPPLGQQ